MKLRWDSVSTSSCSAVNGRYTITSLGNKFVLTDFGELVGKSKNVKHLQTLAENRFTEERTWRETVSSVRGTGFFYKIRIAQLDEIHDDYFTIEVFDNQYRFKRSKYFQGALESAIKEARELIESKEKMDYLEALK